MFYDNPTSDNTIGSGFSCSLNIVFYGFNGTLLLSDAESTEASNDKSNGLIPIYSFKFFSVKVILFNKDFKSEFLLTCSFLIYWSVLYMNNNNRIML